MSGKRTLKPTGWVVDLRHYLDEETGDLQDAIPERVLALAAFFGAIVAWVTDHLPEGDEYSNVPCRRSPGRRRCRGEIIALLDRRSGYIEWHCPLCGDNGLIHGWEDTPWDRQHDTHAVSDDPVAANHALTTVGVAPSRQVVSRARVRGVRTPLASAVAIRLMQASRSAPREAPEFESHSLCHI